MRTARGDGVPAKGDRGAGAPGVNKDGKASSAAATRETRKVNGLTVTLVDVRGTYVAEMTPGAAAHHNQTHYRLRAGVVETPNGPYFIKLTGPEKTIAKWDAAFNQFVGSMQFK